MRLFYTFVHSVINAIIRVNDRNGNGIWDTGNFEKGEQPEEVYYYNMILEPKANWDFQ